MRILSFTLVPLLAAGVHAQPAQSEQAGLNAVVQKDREFLAALPTEGTTVTAPQSAPPTSPPAAPQTVYQAAPKIVPELPAQAVPHEMVRSVRQEVAVEKSRETARKVPPKSKPDSAPTATAAKRQKIARKAPPAKNRTPVRRAVAIIDQPRSGGLVEHSAPRPAAVAEPPLIAAEEKMLRAVRNAEAQPRSVRRKEASPNLWARIFGPDDDEDDDDEDDDDDEEDDD